MKQHCCQQLLWATMLLVIRLLSIYEQLLPATHNCTTTYHTRGNSVVGNSCQQQSCFMYGLLKSKILCGELKGNFHQSTNLHKERYTRAHDSTSVELLCCI